MNELSCRYREAKNMQFVATWCIIAPLSSSRFFVRVHFVDFLSMFDQRFQLFLRCFAFKQNRQENENVGIRQQIRFENEVLD